jgi:site-specific recombinase XerD
MKLTQAVEKFLIAKQADGVKESTITWYQTSLRRLIDMYGNWDISEVGIDDARAYIVKLRSETVSTHTLFKWVRALRSLMKWLYEERKIDDDFHRRINLPRLPNATPKGVDLDDVKALLDSCGANPAGFRDESIILFLMDTGCRVGGLCGLLMEGLDLEHRSAKIFEKGDKGRLVLLNDPVVSALERWIEARPFPECEWLFTSLVEAAPMNPNSVIQMLRRRAKRVGVTGRINPHAFRHGFAREFIRNGGDIGVLSDLLGHAGMAITKK